MTIERGVLFSGTIANGATKYVAVPIRNGVLGAHIVWHDATSSATITLELSSVPVGVTVAGAADQWADSGLTFTGPAASAIGSLLVNVENCRQKQARLKIVAAAATQLDVWDGTAPA